MAQFSICVYIPNADTGKGNPFPFSKKPDMDKIRPEILALKEEVVRLRRQIHRNPEPAFQEVKTAKLAADYLRSCGIEVKEGIAKTGVVGLLRGKENQQTKTLLIRADMDALPIQEENKVEYASQVPGMMHACGHDGHVAILLGAAAYLGAQEKLPGNIKFVFQPAEEKDGGALPMIREGVMENPKVDRVLALHLANDYPFENVVAESGPVTAQEDEFHVEILGKGGHGAYPHEAVDPVVAASQAVIGLNVLLSRGRNPFEPVVFSIGRIEGGKASNVIPAKVILEGTLRTFHSDVREDFLKKMEMVLQGISQSNGTTYTFSLKTGYPPCVNDPDFTKIVIKCAEGLLDRKVIQPAKGMGAEDMAYFLQAAPGCIFGLGSNTPDKAFGPHHSPTFDIVENSLIYGIELFVQIVETYFGIR